MHRLLDIRLNQRPEDVLEYLQVLFPVIKFSSDIEEVGERKTPRRYIYTDTLLSDEKAKEIYQKLKLTSVHFIDRNNYVYN